jgi:TolA-binding protein
VKTVKEEEMSHAPRRRRRVLPAATFTLAALWASAAFAQEDTLTLKDGTQLSVRVTAEDFDEVSYTLRGATVKSAWKDVKEIAYGSAQEYLAALEPFNAGRLEEAAKLFEEMKKESSLRPVLKQHMLYRLATIRYRQGDLDAAVKEFEALLKSYPKSRFLRDAGERLIECQLALGDAAGAAKALAQIVSQVESGASAKVQGDLSMLRGRVLEAQRKVDEARAAYTAAAAAPGTTPGQVREAQLGIARCEQLAGKTAEAEKLYAKLLVDDSPRQVLAGAWNGIGDAILHEGRQKRDSVILLDALYAYMRGVVQYKPTPEEPTGEHERALCGAFGTLTSMEQLEPKGERKRSYQDRAKALRDQLRRLYPNSPCLKR